MKIKRAVAALIMLLLFVGTQVCMAQTELSWYYCCAQTERAEMFGKWAREFESLNPGVKINDLYPASAGGTYYDKVSVSIAGDMAPDVFWAGNGLWTYVDMLMPLDDLYKSDPLIKEIVPAMIEAHRWKGKLIAIPYGVNAHAFFYNKDLFNTVGINMPKDWTWTEAITMGKKITADLNGDGNADRWGLAFTDSGWHAVTYGGNVYSSDLRKVLIDNPVTTAGIQLTADLLSGKTGAYYPLGANYNDFVAGKIGAEGLGPFQVPAVTRDAKFEWDIVMYPRLEVDKKYYRTSYYAQEAWVIYAGTKHPQLAKKFLTFIMQKDKMGEFAAQGAIIPTQPSVAVRSFLSTNKKVNMLAFTDTLNYYKNTERQHPTSMRIDSFTPWAYIISGQTPAAIAVPELARQMQVLVDEYWAKHDK